MCMNRAIPADAASLDWTPPRAPTLARRIADGVRNFLDAAAMLALILLLCPWLWLCCREEERDRRLKAADGGVR